MKSLFKYTFLLFALMATTILWSCKEDKDEDEEDELELDFQTGGSFVSADATIASGTAITIGIEAGTEKAKDPIIRFTVSKSVDGGSTSTAYTEDLSDVEYEYEFDYTITDQAGSVILFTFTITNRDGLIKQKTLTITVS